MGLLFCILGLVWWFPIGLVILTAFIISRAIGSWRRPQFAGSVPSAGWDFFWEPMGKQDGGSTARQTRVWSRKLG